MFGQIRFESGGELLCFETVETVETVEIFEKRNSGCALFQAIESAVEIRMARSQFQAKSIKQILAMVICLNQIALDFSDSNLMNSSKLVLLRRFRDQKK